MEARSKISMPLPDVARRRVHRLLSLRKGIDREMEIYLGGILAGQGIDDTRLIGLNEDDTAIEYHVEAEIAPPN